jgi:hypothetical protein
VSTSAPRGADGQPDVGRDVPVRGVARGAAQDVEAEVEFVIARRGRVVPSAFRGVDDGVRAARVTRPKYAAKGSLQRSPSSSTTWSGKRARSVSTMVPARLKPPGASASRT